MATELLSPAGTLKSMRYAFAYGADAVYAGQPRNSLRVRNNEFHRLDTLASGIKEAQRQNKQFYLACNIAPHNDKVRSLVRDLEPIIAMKPDALIMSDPGFIMLVRECWPEQAIHLSVQANTVNWAAVKFWQRQGIERVILSRELAIDEIEDIRQHCPDMELEVFVHGALCIAYSGRCLLSGYMTHRDSNQGACTNSCRWEYNAHPATTTDSGDIIAREPPSPSATEHHLDHWQPAAKTIDRQLSDAAVSDTAVFDTGKSEPLLLQEKSRPGDYLPAYEDQHGTYIMNSKDLRAVQHVERLVRMGIHSLKIEGRTKSHYYVARTAQIYRRAIDAAERGQPFDWRWMSELEHLANRGYTEGFYRRHAPQDYQNYTQGSSAHAQQQFVGEVLDGDIATGLVRVEVKNRFASGDTLELMSPLGNRRFRLEHMENSKGQKQDVAPGSGHVMHLRVDASFAQAASEYSLLIRHD